MAAAAVVWNHKERVHDTGWQ